MAYHELLARVADNYQSVQGRATDEEPHEGLHQIIADREIDPSLPPIPFTAFNERGGEGESGWGPASVGLPEWPTRQINFSSYRGDIEAFLADEATEPTIASYGIVRGVDGSDWVVLQSYQRQTESPEDRVSTEFQQAATVHSLLVDASQTAELMDALKKARSYQLDNLVDQQGHADCCYVGEVGRTGPRCYHRHADLEPARWSGTTQRTVASVEEYIWEGSLLDCSIGDSARAVLPSTFIQARARLSFSVDGPSWVDDTGTVIFTNYADADSPSHALLVRADWFREFLAANNVQLVLSLWFHRVQIDNDHSARHPMVDAHAIGYLDNDLVVHEHVVARVLRRPPAD